MHYYKRNIGDYAKKAGKLSMLEHGAYTLLIDACYDRECFPTEADAIEWCWARTTEEIAAVKFVLSRFFKLIDGLYVQSRVIEELEKYRETAQTNSRIATEREAKRKERARSVHESSKKTHEAPPNQEPRTTNHKPEESPKGDCKKSDLAILVAEGVDEQTAADFLKVRKAKRAPLTKTAIDGIKREAGKAGISFALAVAICAERSWQGFRHDWAWQVSSVLKSPNHQSERDRVAGEIWGAVTPTQNNQGEFDGRTFDAD